MESVRTGKTIIPALRGKEWFDYLADDPEFAKLFNHAMTSLSEMAEATVIAGYDFSPYSTIVDVGGGHGRLLAGILAATPAAQGVLYDLPHVVAGAPALLRQRGVEDRVRVEGGRFSKASRLAAPHMSSRWSSTTGPMSRQWRFCEACMRQPVATRRCY